MLIRHITVYVTVQVPSKHQLPNSVGVGVLKDYTDANKFQEECSKNIAHCKKG